MKVLAVSDIESPSLYDYFSPEKVEGVELIVGCGDLRMEYLEFLVTMMNVPLIYIHGNHDDHFRREPEGCICIDDDVFEYKGLRFVGLGGSIRYKPKFFLHGHIHRNYGARIPQVFEHDGTTIINATDYCIFEIAEPSAEDEKEKEKAAD